MHRYLFFLIAYLTFTLCINAQYSSAPYMQDNTPYKANKIENKQPNMAVVNIQQISLGNGIQVYKDIDKNTFLTGDYLIQIFREFYALATFNKGLLQNQYEEYRSKSLSKKLNYKNGLLEGEQFTFYPEGPKRSITNYQNGKILSSTSFHDNGSTQETELYDEFGSRNGPQITYDSNGKKTKERNYVHGSIQGKSVEYTDAITTIMYYNNERPEGEFKVLYANGKPKTEGEYSAITGNKEGIWSNYFENGLPESEISYSNDRQDGSSKQYFGNGKLQYDIEYKNGKRDGKYLEYSESPHSLVMEASYADGKLDGIFKSYNEGQIWRDCIYKNGKLISEKQYLNGKISVLKMLNEYGDLVNVKTYDSTGKTNYQNKQYKKNHVVRLVEDDYGIIDVE